MADIHHTGFRAYLAKNFSPAPVYLIFGEEYLYKSVYSDLVRAILPSERLGFALEELEGTDDNVHEAIERLTTFSLDAGAKVIGLVDANIFYAKDDAATLIQRLKTALGQDAGKKAAGLFLKLLSLLEISPESMTADDRQRLRELDPEAADKDAPWLETAIACLRERRSESAPAGDAVAALTAAIEKGFAPGNHLIITAETVDKRRKLYKAVQDHGLVVDCSVPLRDTRADRAKQTEALSETMRAVLDPAGKTMAPDAFAALCDLTGFNLRVFHTNLEKLIAFTGDRAAITARDVADLLKRTKQDPIYELTGAVFDKNTPQALGLLESLLTGAEGMHPLQLLAAMVNQTRKLLIIRDFMDGDGKKCWRPGMTFDRFKQTAPAPIEAHDAAIRDHLARQEDSLTGDDETGKKSKKAKAPASDLAIGANPANLFPTYKNFTKADRFSRRELTLALTALADADRRLKSSGVEARLILEELIIRITRPDIQTEIS